MHAHCSCSTCIRPYLLSHSHWVCLYWIGLHINLPLSFFALFVLQLPWWSCPRWQIRPMTIWNRGWVHSGYTSCVSQHSDCLAPCWVWYIHSPACHYWDTSYIPLGNERAIFGWRWSVKKLDSWGLPVYESLFSINDMLEWRRGLYASLAAGLRSLLINARGEERWCHQKVPGVSLQREQCEGGHDLRSPSNMSSSWRQFTNRLPLAGFLASHCQDPLCLPLARLLFITLAFFFLF